MSIKWSDLPDKVADLPLQLEDGIVFSHTTDGGTTFSASKFGSIEELKTFLGISSISIPDDMVVTGTGTGLQGANLKISDIDLDESVYISHPDHHNGTDYAIYIYDDGSPQLNAGVGKIIIASISNTPKWTVSGDGMSISTIPDDIVTIGTGVVSSPSGAKLHIRGLGSTSATNALTISNSTGGATHMMKLQDDGLFSLLNGTGINEFSIDGTLADDSDDAVPTEKAVKAYVDAQSGGGWLGSQTRIKLAPWDIVSYNDKDGISIQDDGGVANDAAGKISEMITGVYIPTGYKATAFMIYASANISVELYESQIDDSTAVSKGSGNANTEVNITDITSTDTNYLSIVIVETGNDITGGYVTIEKL